jgi:hypothetical protein
MNTNFISKETPTPTVVIAQINLEHFQMKGTNSTLLLFPHQLSSLPCWCNWWGWTCSVLPFEMVKSLVRWSTSCLSISFSMATSSVDDYTITFSTQTCWLHLGESNSIKSMQEVEESFLIISKSEILLGALVGVFALASSFSSLLVNSTFKFAKKKLRICQLVLYN